MNWIWSFHWALVSVKLHLISDVTFFPELMIETLGFDFLSQFEF